MHVTTELNPHDHAQACELLEAICEGVVRSMVAEIDAHPEGTFPCCIKCGKFCTRNAPLTPAQAQAIEFTLQHGHPRADDRIELEGVLSEHGYYMPDDMTAPAEDEYEADAPSRNQDSFGYEFCLPANRRGDPPPQHGATIHFACASQILRRKTGHTLELACYQAAQKRRHTDPDAKVMVLCSAPGTFRAIVMCSPNHEKPERRGAIDDPVVDARPVGGCGCDLPLEQQEYDGP